MKMKIDMQKAMIAATGLLLSSCFYSRPVPVVREMPRNNPSYRVDYLFEHGGCKVYRFYDPGTAAYVYFTNCNGNARAVAADSTERSISQTITSSREDTGTNGFNPSSDER